MKSLLVKGVIIREVPVGEADKILTILTKEYGLMTVSAKNARRPKNHMMFSTSALVFGEFELFGSENTRYYVNQVNTIETFQNLREDVVMLTYCAHITDIVSDVTRDSSSSEEIYTLLMYTLYTLGRLEKDPDLTVHTFELKLLFLLGYLPVLHSCVLCGKPLSGKDFSALLFSFEHCGACCPEISCASHAGERQVLSLPVWNCLCYIAQAPIDKVYAFSLDPIFIKELSTLASRYLCDRMERNYTKLSMLREFSLGDRSPKTPEEPA